jgi:hypothetical protein
MTTKNYEGLFHNFMSKQGSQFITIRPGHNEKLVLDSVNRLDFKESTLDQITINDSAPWLDITVPLHNTGNLLYSSPSPGYHQFLEFKNGDTSVVNFSVPLNYKLGSPFYLFFNCFSKNREPAKITLQFLNGQQMESTINFVNHQKFTNVPIKIESDSVVPGEFVSVKLTVESTDKLWIPLAGLRYQASRVGSRSPLF